MTVSEKPSEKAGDRIRLPLDFDASRMLEEVQSMNLGDFIYYDVLPLRAPAHLVDPSIAAPPPADTMTSMAEGRPSAPLLVRSPRH